MLRTVSLTRGPLPPVFLFVFLTGCGGLDAPIGDASCRASARGACPELSDRTVYRENRGSLVYYAPSGVLYQASSTAILKGEWRVDAAGTSLTLYMPGAGVMGAGAIDAVVETASVPGDPGQLSTKDSGFHVQHFDERSFETLLREAAAR